MRIRITGLFIICMMIIFISINISGCNQTPTHQAEILFITKDQSDTRSLNPTRMEVAAAMALESCRNENKEAKNIHHHFIRYTGDEEEGYHKAKAYLESNQSVVALVGDFNSVGTEYVARLAEEFQLPHLSFFATDIRIFEEHPQSYSYRSQMSHETTDLIAMASYRLNKPYKLNKLDKSKVAVLYNDLSNIEARWLEFESLAPAHGIQVVEKRQVSREERDFRPVLAAYKELEQDVDSIILFLSSGQLEHFLQQANREEIATPIIASPVTFSPETATELPRLNMPFYSTVQEIYMNLQQGEDEMLEGFANAYRVYVGYHQMDGLGPWIYDGVRLIHELTLQKRRPMEIKEALDQYHEKRMIGQLSFDKNGLIKESTYVKVFIEDGCLKEIKDEENH
ncbi:ABC-type branched-chain amino acid transport system, substrate-binding protein [Tindallia magadiensis]|uniref:ABC-type branched-chain amino acid transport system, substrate-binding protein n=1 Tax=Tindallia magadiensis TaxID=69895 RepID=A0A1I3H4X9_9FIRM|nr:ABC transporter substrate-binding protein [Tindallia magadiensis]SFI30754.1 ABC-type branched-chain amino acid transport system, substrate-binding protein [Tindallia magadiensis]